MFRDQVLSHLRSATPTSYITVLCSLFLVKERNICYNFHLDHPHNSTGSDKEFFLFMMPEPFSLAGGVNLEP